MTHKSKNESDKEADSHFQKCEFCGAPAKENENSFWCSTDYCEWLVLKQNRKDVLYVVAVYIVGHDSFPVAWFRYPHLAYEWAREYYSGQWLTKIVQVPAETLFTEEQWVEAEKEAKELREELGWNTLDMDNGNES